MYRTLNPIQLGSTPRRRTNNALVMELADILDSDSRFWGFESPEGTITLSARYLVAVHISIRWLYLLSTNRGNMTMDNQTQDFIREITKAREIALQYNRVELLNPCCDAEEWTLCEELLKAFRYSLTPAPHNEWKAELSSMEIVAVGKHPREAVLRCFFAHMKRQTEIF